MELPQQLGNSSKQMNAAFDNFQKMRRDVPPLGGSNSNNNNSNSNSSTGSTKPAYTWTETKESFPQQQQQQLQGSSLAMYRNVDLNTFVPPRILLYNRKLYPFDPRNIVFAPVKVRQNRSRCVDLGYRLVVPEDHLNLIVSPIQLQTPMLRAPFGVSHSAYNNAEESHSLDLSFGNVEDDAALANFYKAFVLLDDLVIKKAVENFTDKSIEPQHRWINDPYLQPEMIAHFYKKISAIRIKKSTNEEFPPRITMKIGMQSGHLAVTCFDRDLKTIELDAIAKRCAVRAIMRFNGVWFQNRSFSVSTYAQQIRVCEYAFNDAPEFVEDTDQMDETNEAAEPTATSSSFVV